MKLFKINKISLLFDSKSDEKAFSDYFFRENQVTVRYSLILLFVINFILFGNSLLNIKSIDILSIFIIVVSLFIVTHFIISYFQIYTYRFQQVLIFFTMLIIFSTSVVSLHNVTFTENQLVYVVLMILIFLLMLFSRLKFVYAAITLSIFIIFFEINALKIYYTLSTFPISYGNLYVFLSSALAIPAGYYFEYYQRKRFFSEVESSQKIDELDNYLQVALKDDIKFQKILDDMPVLVMAVNSEYEICFWNKKCQKLTGFSVDEIINNPLAKEKLFPESGYRDRVFKKFLTEKHFTANFETRLATKTGSKRIIQWSHIEKNYYISNSPLWYSGIDITENYETWKALKKSEQRLKESQGLTHVGSWEWDVLKNRTVWSDELYRIFGYLPQNSDFDVSTIFKKILHPEDLEFFKSETQKAIIEKHGVNFEYRIRLEDGSERIISAEGDVIMNEKNEVVRLFGTNRDITEIKEGEIELLKNRKILEKAQKIANVASWEYDYVKKKTIVSEEFYRIFQIKKFKPNRIQSLIYKSIADDDRTIFRNFLYDTFIKYINAGCEFKVILKDGDKTSVKTISASTEIELNKNTGKPQAVYGIFQDITVLKKALDSIENNARKIRNIVQSSPDAIIVFEENKKIIDCNFEATIIFGYTKQEFTNMSIQNLFTAHSYELFHNKFRQVFDTTDSLKNYQLDMLGAKNTEFPAEMSLAFIKSFDDEPNSAVALIKNITERKQYEQKLQDARLKAEESDKLKSAFLANMSHEIRTPMNAIVGFSNLLTDNDISTEERNEYLKYIISGSDSLLSLIDDIIDISKIESGQIQLKKTPVSLAELIGELFVEFDKQKIKAEKEHIELKFNVRDEILELSVETDELRLKQILNNLFSNALKFTKQGSIEFGYELTSQYGIKLIEFFVKDTGIGIRKEDLNIIFNRFTKLETGLSEPLHRGTGLGLAICKKLVALMGGKIWAESELTKGSVFRFALPLKISEPKTTSNTQVMISQTNYLWDTKTILIAEDEETNFKYLSAALRKTKVKVLWAQDGQQAFTMCGKHPEVDLILMDIQMPVMDGYEATRKIKAFRPQLPIIAQTAYTLSTEKERILDIGCDGYLPKPINSDKLMSTIAGYF